MLLNRILLGVHIEIIDKGAAFGVFNFREVLVRVKLIAWQLHGVDRNIRAMVGNALVIGQKIGEYKAKLDCTFAALKPCDMAGFELFVKRIYNLLERLDMRGKLNIVIYKGVLLSISLTAFVITSISFFASSEK